TSLRALISAIAVSPMAIARPLTLASEVLGILLFLNLLETTRVVLRADAELRDAVEERLCEIITDELGHMSFNRQCLGAAGIAQARMLLPFVATGLSGAFPELRALGTMSSASDDELRGLASGRRLPEEVVRSAFLSGTRTADRTHDFSPLPRDRSRAGGVGCHGRKRPSRRA